MGVCARTVRNWIAQGKLPGLRGPHGRYIVDSEELERWRREQGATRAREAGARNLAAYNAAGGQVSHGLYLYLRQGALPRELRPELERAAAMLRWDLYEHAGGRDGAVTVAQAAIIESVIVAQVGLWLAGRALEEGGWFSKADGGHPEFRRLVADSSRLRKELREGLILLGLKREARDPLDLRGYLAARDQREQPDAPLAKAPEHRSADPEQSSSPLPLHTH